MSKTEEARRLAEVHYGIEDGITKIYRVTTASSSDEVQPDEPIKLLEVNENTIPSGVMPLSFGPSPSNGINHSSIIIEVTPDEFTRIEREELALPNGWRIESLLARPSSVES